MLRFKCTHTSGARRVLRLRNRAKRGWRLKLKRGRSVRAREPPELCCLARYISLVESLALSLPMIEIKYSAARQDQAGIQFAVSTPAALPCPLSFRSSPEERKAQGKIKIQSRILESNQVAPASVPAAGHLFDCAGFPLQ